MLEAAPILSVKDTARIAQAPVRPVVDFLILSFAKPHPHPLLNPRHTKHARVMGALSKSALTDLKSTPAAQFGQDSLHRHSYRTCRYSTSVEAQTVRYCTVRCHSFISVNACIRAASIQSIPPHSAKIIANSRARKNNFGCEDYSSVKCQVTCIPQTPIALPLRTSGEKL